MAEAYRRCQRRRGMVSSGQRTGDEYKNQRRRSRAVLYHLSGQFEKQNRAKSKLQQFNKVITIAKILGLVEVILKICKDSRFFFFFLVFAANLKSC